MSNRHPNRTGMRSSLPRETADQTSAPPGFWTDAGERTARRSLRRGSTGVIVEFATSSVERGLLLGSMGAIYERQQQHKKLGIIIRYLDKIDHNRSV